MKTHIVFLGLIVCILTACDSPEKLTPAFLTEESDEMSLILQNASNLPKRTFNQPDANLVESLNNSIVSKPQFVKGLPLLKSKGDNTYFYDGSNRLVKILSKSGSALETLIQYDGNLKVAEYKKLNLATVARPEPKMGSYYAVTYFDYNGNNELVRSLNETLVNYYYYDKAKKQVRSYGESTNRDYQNPKLSFTYQFDDKGNMIRSSSYGAFESVVEQSFDQNISPTSNWNLSGNQLMPFETIGNNVVSRNFIGGLFPNSKQNYSFVYNKYGLPVSITNQNGQVELLSYYE
ncbi:MAG: hypothetical protein ACRCVT_04585 [Leadbetterella sp.]